jgi:HD-GYP domain-containing protein (c-di-GMP phosphodiesterase class II)
MSYDYYTFTHSINVCVFSVALANQIGLHGRAELHDFAVGALLHDLGESEIPKPILNKTGALTAEEMEIMRSHVIRGENILLEKGQMSATRMLPVSLHDERLDGTGYPGA